MKSNNDKMEKRVYGSSFIFTINFSISLYFLIRLKSASYIFMDVDQIISVMEALIIECSLKL